MIEQDFPQKPKRLASMIWSFNHFQLFQSSVPTVDGSEIQTTTWDGAKTRRK